MKSLFKTIISAVLATTTFSLSISAHAETAAQTIDPATQKGMELFRGIFFDAGSYGGKLPELHLKNAKLFLERDATVSRDPEKILALADYLATVGDAQNAQNAYNVAEALESDAVAVKPSVLEARELLLNAMHDEDPTFFTSFSKSATSGDTYKVHSALINAGNLVGEGAVRLKSEGVDIGDIGLGPQEGTLAVFLVLVLVVLVNLVVTIDIKDTPDDVAPPCEGDDCDCGGGGDCEFVVPVRALTSKTMAALIAERFAGAK